MFCTKKSDSMMKTPCVIIFRAGRVQEFPKQIEKCFYGLLDGHGQQSESHGFIKSIDYDFAANVNVFAAKFSRLICNNFAANFLTNSRLFLVFFPYLKM